MIEEITNKVLRQVVAKLEVMADEEVLNPGLFPTPQSFTFNSLRDVVDSLATMCDYYGEDDYETMMEDFRDNLLDPKEELEKLSKQLNGLMTKAQRDYEDPSDILELEYARDYLQLLTEPTFVDSSADTDTTEGPLPLAAVGAAVIIGSNI